MARHFAWVVVILLAIGAPASVAGHEGQGEQREGGGTRPQDPNRWKWWLNPDDRKELGITDQQSAAIEQIWSSVAPLQRENWRELERLETELDKTLKAATTEAGAVAQQVEKVEKLRATVNATRTVMLYRISQVLTPDQRVKLEAHRARRDANRRRQPDNKDKPGRW